MKSTSLLILAVSIAAGSALVTRADDMTASQKSATDEGPLHVHVAHRLVADNAKPDDGDKADKPATKDLHLRRLDRDPHEMESVPFLGVQASPVSPTLVAQLNLPNGAGLVVGHVVAGSAAATVLKAHDILLKLDDQILVNEGQLSVLIRNHKEGDEVTLTYLRAGKEQTAKVKLTKHEVPKMMGMIHGAIGIRGDEFGGGGDTREQMDRVLAMIKEAHGGAFTKVQIDDNDEQGFRAMALNTGNSNLVFSDDAGSLELTTKDGKKHLVAHSPKGETEFDGPVTTPEERKAVPAAVRSRLEKLESMQDVTFHTDGAFQGTQARVFRPQGEAIVLPAPRRPASAPQVF